jgi:hypothetical protein
MQQRNGEMARIEFMQKCKIIAQSFIVVSSSPQVLGEEHSSSDLGHRCGNGADDAQALSGVGAARRPKLLNY